MDEPIGRQSLLFPSVALRVSGDESFLKKLFEGGLERSAVPLGGRVFFDVFRPRICRNNFYVNLRGFLRHSEVLGIHDVSHRVARTFHTRLRLDAREYGHERFGRYAYVFSAEECAEFPIEGRRLVTASVED